MEHFGKIENREKTPLEKFKELFGAELTEISYEDLPQIAKDHFENQSRKFIHPDTYTVGNFSTIFKFTHAGGDVTYIGEQNKVYDTNNSTERLTYFADTRGSELTGYIETRLALTDLTDYFKSKPFVGFSRTKEEFLRQGLALRRLEEANAYALATYGHPLHSDSIVTAEARSVWERLITDGKAEQYTENGKKRFRFISV